MLAIGYPIYWLELYAGRRDGLTSSLAWTLFTSFFIFVLIRERSGIAAGFRDVVRWFRRTDRWIQLFAAAAMLLIAVILTASIQAAFLPPHLMQESDAMNYHYSLPRQHLILQSMDRISWSGLDLFLMPVDYALAPFWFATELPNKFPQLIFFLGLCGILISLARTFERTGWMTALLAVVFMFGSHGFGIQMGTAMLDFTVTYLFLAAVDSFFKRAHWLFIIEAVFYVWSKPLLPLSVFGLVLILGAIIWVSRTLGVRKILWSFEGAPAIARPKEGIYFLRQCALGLLAMSVLAAGPFIVRSNLYAGTPFFPIGMGAFAHPLIADTEPVWNSLSAVSHYMTVSVYNNYGAGRSFVDFFRHLWFIAVPLKGVNNAFDYPVGLPYLLALGAFAVFFIQSLRRREIPLLPLMVVVMWGLWWMGSQQSRWLYVPLLLMFLTTALRMPKPSKILMAALFIALAINSLSVVRAFKGDWGKSAMQALREQDRRQVEMSRDYRQSGRRDAVELEEYEVAFAQFPVVVRKESLPNAVRF